MTIIPHQGRKKIFNRAALPVWNTDLPVTLKTRENTVLTNKRITSVCLNWSQIDFQSTIADWLVGRLPDWLTGWFTDQLLKWLTNWLTDLTDWLTKGAFFWDYSRIGILGIDGICVLLGAIPFSEWTEYHSIHSAPDSRMNRMNGIRFTRNRQNTRSFGKFLLGNPMRLPAHVQT